MELDHYIEDLRRQLAVAAEAGGDDARAVAERLFVSLDSAVRLTALELLAAAAAEITREMAPGSVDVRLRGRDPEFVVTTPAFEPAGDYAETTPTAPGDASVDSRSAGDAAVSRLNLRLPDQLKARIEQAADREGLSINAWLVRVAAAAVERGQGRPQSTRRGSSGEQRYSGWVR